MLVSVYLNPLKKDILFQLRAEEAVSRVGNAFSSSSSFHVDWRESTVYIDFRVGGERGERRESLNGPNLLRTNAPDTDFETRKRGIIHYRSMSHLLFRKKIPRTVQAELGIEIK